MDDFLGKTYVLYDSENFEDYLVYLGLSYIARKVAIRLNQSHILTKNEDGTYTFQFLSTMANSSVTFNPGEEFEEIKADGVKVKALIVFEGNKMIHTQTADDGKVSRHEREFFVDKMIVITTADGLDKTVKRYYKVEQQ
uniref:SFRICE_009768 n=1 Tax=Spodoptera frugiperda TaxID=7108 RepID=A0A2H1VWS6_SPOFR